MTLWTAVTLRWPFRTVLHYSQKLRHFDSASAGHWVWAAPSQENTTLGETAGEENFQEELTSEGLGPSVLRGELRHHVIVSASGTE